MRARLFVNRRGKRLASQEGARRGKLQRHNPFSTEDTERRGELQHLFVRGGRGGARRTSTPFLSAEVAERRGELQHLFCPRRSRRGAENFNTFFVRGGRGGARRTSTPFCPRRSRRGAENFNTFFVRGGRGGAGRTSTLFLSAEDAENTLDLLSRGGQLCLL